MADQFKAVNSAPDFQVKSSWPVVRLWNTARLRSQRNRPDLPLLSVFLNRGVIQYGDGGGQVHKPGLDLTVYQVVRRGDFVLNNQQAWRGSVGVSKHEGIISPAYVVLDLSKDLDARFADYQFQSRDMVAQYVTSSKGVGDIQRDIHMPWLKNAKVPLPPRDEQDLIVRFLDWTTGRLERTIRAKKRVISLLNEQKQSIINRAVTRGLDPGVSLKPAGIPWIGDIPAHWRVRRAKYIYREADDRSADGSEELLSVSHITGVTPRSQKNITMFKAASYSGHKLCRPGDLVVNTMWAWMGALGVSEHTGIISPAYAVYRPHHPDEVVGEFIDGLLRSRPYISNIICRSTGLRASRLRLYPDEFFRLPLVLPPAEEQHRIVASIRLETAKLTKSILRYEREIELLREYRTRLAADVVTGKLDVQQAAAALPDKVRNADSVDEEDLIETDEGDEEFAEEGLASE